MHDMLFSGWHGYAIFSCSVVIAMAYLIIPRALHTIEDHGRDIENSKWLIAITSSSIFRAFIRFCGINHIIMSGVMLSTANGWIEITDFWRNLLLFGEGSVASVSVLAALATWRTKWHLDRN